MRLRLCLLPLLAAGCGGAPPAEPRTEPERPPDVVLFVADTLRSDHLSAYGYGLPTSPNLDELAEGATVYTGARSTAPWTLPSHASMFTGLFPFQHGAQTVVDRPNATGAKGLTEQAVTLAEVLREVGYRTVGVAANNVFLDPKYGLSQGFDLWSVNRVPFAESVDAVLAAVAREPDQPLFLFINAMDTHRPYNSTEIEGFLPRPVGENSRELLDSVYKALYVRGEEPEPNTIRALVDQYDTAIAHLDEAFGDLIDGLDALGRLEGAVVAFTSDHGEFFGEHGLIEHSKDVYEPVLRVPLVVKAPRQVEGAVDDSDLSSAHLPGLLVECLPDELRAEVADLAPRLIAPEVDTIVAENLRARRLDLRRPRLEGRFQRARRAYYADGYKLIHSGDGAHELFALESDPDETRNLFLTETERAEAIRRRFERLMEELQRLQASDRAVDVSEEDLRQLELLGYR